MDKQSATQTLTAESSDVRATSPETCSRPSDDLTDEDGYGETIDDDVCEDRCVTPKASSTHDKQRSNDAEPVQSLPTTSTSLATVETDSNLNTYELRAAPSRKHSLSIVELIGTPSSTQQTGILRSRRSSARIRESSTKGKMDFGMHSPVSHHEMLPHNGGGGDDSGSGSMSGNDLDPASLSVLTNASRAASFDYDSHAVHPNAFDFHEEPHSRASSSFSMHSSLASLTDFNSEDDSDGHNHIRYMQQFSAGHDVEGEMYGNALQLQTSETMDKAPMGRTRSDTVRRNIHWLASSSSAPAVAVGGMQHHFPSAHSDSSQSPASHFRAMPDHGGATTVSVGRHLDERHRTISSTSVASGDQSSSMTDAESSSSNSMPMRKKRNKCSPEQSRQLEAFFAKNRNPTGKIREELAKRIQMPERSVQVWFQNKRAKTKLIEIKEGVPPEQRTTVSKPKPQQQRSSSAGEGTSATGSARAGPTSSISRRKKTITQASQADEPVIQLPVTSLCVGQWRRIKPLICLFSRRNQSFTWYLSSESVGFKLNCPRAYITRIVFTGPRDPTVNEFGEGLNTQIGQLMVELDRPPQFFMEVFRSSGAKESESEPQKASWRQCADFTEGKHATTVFTHIISGPYVEMRQATMKLCDGGGPIGQIVEFLDQPHFASPTARLTGVGSDLSTMNPPMPAPVYDAMTQQQQQRPASSHGHNHNLSLHDVGVGDQSGREESLYYGTSWLTQQESSFQFSPSSNASPALDMTRLQIDTGTVPALEHDGHGGRMIAHQHGPHLFGANHGASMSASHLGHWPHTATQASHDWPTHHLTGGSGAHGEGTTGLGSQVASAPAYATSTFQRQQQDVLQVQQNVAFPGPHDVHMTSMATMPSVEAAAQVGMHANMFAQPHLTVTGSESNHDADRSRGSSS